MKNYLKMLFSFSRKELNGVLVLAVLLFLLIVSQPLTNWLVRSPETDLSAFDSDIALFLQADSAGGGESGIDAGSHGHQGSDSVRRSTAAAGSARLAPTAAAAGVRNALFPFDPNTITLEQLLQLGLQKSVAATLLNYRKAGGRFYKKEDLKKVYGLETSVYQRLRPYIRILPSDYPAGEAGVDQAGYAASDPDQAAEPPVAAHQVIALNAADSAALLPLPGIGPVLSARIVKYRERLGGFHSAGQLLEVYGLDTVAFQKIRPQLRVDSAGVKKINLNTASYEELRRLPYWSSGQINTVLNYREQHGEFSSLNELHEIRALEKHIIQKVMPYLSLENTNQ